MTMTRAKIKQGDIVFLKERRIRAKVLGFIKFLVLLEIEGSNEKLKARRGDIRLVHPRI